MITRCFHKKILKAGCVFLGAVLLLFAFLPPAGAESGTPDLDALIVSAFEARTAHTVSGGRMLGDPAFLETHAGTGTGDWIAFAMARYGFTEAGKQPVFNYDEDYAAYIAAVQRKLDAYYEETGIRAGTKLTEYFRPAIALSAMGEDESFYVTAATVYNGTDLKRIALMSLDFGLIAYWMRDIEITGTTAHTASDLMHRLLELQLPDGGWSISSLMGGASDVDVTAMTLTALAPYYRAGNAEVTAAAEKALSFLSASQRSAGDFSSYGIFNTESTAQVITALTSMGIDPLADARFIKNGHTALDGLLTYRLADGSFTHSYTDDPENGAAVAGNYNYLATDQAAYALVSLWRQQKGLTTLYDLRPDTKQTAGTLFQRIKALIEALLQRIVSIMTLRADAAESVSPESLRQTAEDIITYKKASLGKTAEEPLFSGDFLKGAGSTAGDWYPFGMAALELEDDYAAYLAALRENVRQRYASPEKLSSNKATEWHRAALAALSCGADPTRFTVDDAGNAVNLIGDGVFYRENIGRQGVNGFIWALIALHTREYPVPGDALNTEESLIADLLSRALPEGGWNMRGTAPDTDITAMALIALAPVQGKNEQVNEAVEKALTALSAAQTPAGGFTEENIENCESSAVVLTALCCLGIDPETDGRFIKNGHTVLDALLSYRLADGSFTHAFEADPEDPDAVPNEPNDMSCQQALYALASLWRYKTEKSNVFDFSAAVLSDEGWDTLPPEPGAVQQAADEATGRLKAFFANEANRKTAISAALAVFVLIAAAILIYRRKKRKQAKNAL
jgi:hypothetical protein